MQRPHDTSAEAWRQQLAAFRRMTPQERLALSGSMSDDLRALVEARIRARHPDYSATELRDAIASVVLGPTPRPLVPRKRTASRP